MLDCRAILASAQAVWVVLWGLGCWSVVMLNFGEVFTPRVGSFEGSRGLGR